MQQPRSNFPPGGTGLPSPSILRPQDTPKLSTPSVFLSPLPPPTASSMLPINFNSFMSVPEAPHQQHPPHPNSLLSLLQQQSQQANTSLVQPSLLSALSTAPSTPSTSSVLSSLLYSLFCLTVYFSRTSSQFSTSSAMPVNIPPPEPDVDLPSEGEKEEAPQLVLPFQPPTNTVQQVCFVFVEN